MCLVGLTPIGTPTLRRWWILLVGCSGRSRFTADSIGYRRMVAWLGSGGQLVRVGVEGCGSYGAGLARYLAEAGIEVVEVNRPNRQLRRQKGALRGNVGWVG